VISCYKKAIQTNPNYTNFQYNKETLLRKMYNSNVK